MKFTKMHGLSNDYIYADGFTQTLPGDPAAVSIKLSKYHTGIGADGLILIEPIKNADARMRIFNADGSEAQICGNGMRCAARYLYDHNLCRKTEMNIVTGAGLKTVWLDVQDGEVQSVTADMGAPVVSEPVRLTAAGRTLTFWPVSMGNPHAVTFEESAKGAEFYTLGPAFEGHAFFPERANIEFTEVVSRTRVGARLGRDHGLRQRRVRCAGGGGFGGAGRAQGAGGTARRRADHRMARDRRPYPDDRPRDACF